MQITSCPRNESCNAITSFHLNESNHRTTSPSENESCTLKTSRTVSESIKTNTSSYESEPSKRTTSADQSEPFNTTTSKKMSFFLQPVSACFPKPQIRPLRGTNPFKGESPPLRPVLLTGDLLWAREGLFIGPKQRKTPKGRVRA